MPLPDAGRLLRRHHHAARSLLKYAMRVGCASREMHIFWPTAHRGEADRYAAGLAPRRFLVIMPRLLLIFLR